MTGAAPSEQQPRRLRLPRGEGARLRDEILAATEKLLLETGSAEAVSIRAVADAVGVTAPSIYRHFPDKQTLIYEVCERHFRALNEHIEAAAEGIEDPVDRMAAMGRAYVEFGRANPEPYRIMFMTGPEGIPIDRQELWFRESQVFLHAVDGVQACIDAGRLRPDLEGDAVRLALGIWARVHGLTTLIISKPFLPIDQAFVDEYLEQCFHGVARLPSTRAD